MPADSARPIARDKDVGCGCEAISVPVLGGRRRKGTLNAGRDGHELELKRRALERIRQGVLPAEIPKTIWAGPGTGMPCSLCDRPVGPAEMEYEIDGRSKGGTQSTLRFHLQCHALPATGSCSLN